MQIGNVAVKNNIFLAPMAGVTDLPFRSICRNYGCGFSYTEMVSSRALHYHDKKTLSLMETGKDEKPCAIQIFGCEPEIMSEASYSRRGGCGYYRYKYGVSYSQDCE